MNVKEFEKNLQFPLIEATVMLLLRNDEVLLAMKKRGFGTGKWNGTGGKLKSGEGVVEGAIRETEEEDGVTPKNPNKVAEFKYLFPLINFGQKVHVFTASEWMGEPVETEEMRPKWFKKIDVPYKEMWIDDEIWMPLIFSGKLLTGSFMFGENEKIEDYYIDEVQSL